MTLPTPPSNTELDQGSDKPKNARAQINALNLWAVALLAAFGNIVEADVGDGLEINADSLRTKLADDTLVRSASGLAVNMQVVWWTGDVKLSIDDTPRTGWVFGGNGGTIGDASSGATARANADTQALFTLIWTKAANSVAPIQDSTGSATTRGASALADFNAHKRLPLPTLAGRALVVAGSGSGLTVRSLYQTWGTETVTLITAELPAHSHNGPAHNHSLSHIHNMGHTHTFTAVLGRTSFQKPTGAGVAYFEPDAPNAGGNTSQASVTTTSQPDNNATTTAGTGVTSDTGSGSPHANTQPSVALNAHIKL